MEGDKYYCVIMLKNYRTKWFTIERAQSEKEAITKAEGRALVHFTKIDEYTISSFPSAVVIALLISDEILEEENNG